MDFVIAGVLPTEGRMHGARVNVRRALRAGVMPRELFQAIRVAGIPGGVPVISHAAAMVKAEMDALGLGDRPALQWPGKPGRAR